MKTGKPILNTCNKFINELGGNCIMGITGMPMTGKSNLAVKIGVDWTNGKIDLDKSIVYNVKELLQRTFSTIKVNNRPLSIEKLAAIDDINKWLMENADTIEIKPGQILIFDEAGTSVYVREFFSQDNKTLSKILQVWRFLRMLTIIVVPGDMRLADSTISKFMNVEVHMKGLKKGEYAKAFVNEYIGWDQKRNQPMKKRVISNRWGGFIKVKPLDPLWNEKYESIVKIHKIRVLAEMGKEYHVSMKEQVARSRNVEDDIAYVLDNEDTFKSKGGSFSPTLIQGELQLSTRKSQYIAAKLNKSLILSAQPRVNNHYANGKPKTPDKLTVPNGE